EEKETGTIESGKSADLVVLDRDPFDLPSDRLREARVILTIREGLETYADPGFRPGR
ncbi:MAG TPA: amidohydrolase family protein, partial [Planctomycetota bacterium]|nr:amidohydrolase family protein [Planctomycetota bacterium]